MKRITTTIIAALAAAVTAHAELDAKEFDQVKAWAEKQGYAYDGIAKRFNALVFKHKTGVIVFAPVTSDTADEAINALIASKVTNAFHAETAKDKADPEQLSKADQEGEEPNLVAAQNKLPAAPEPVEAVAPVEPKPPAPGANGLTAEQSKRMNKAFENFVRTGDFDPVYLVTVEVLADVAVRDFGSASTATTFIAKWAIKDRCLTVAEKLAKIPDSPVLYHVKEAGENLYALVVAELEDRAKEETIAKK